MLQTAKDMRRILIGSLAAIWLAASWFAYPLAAQEPKAPSAGDELAVVTRLVAPFVVSGSNGQLTGFSIDLWRAIAADLGLKTRFDVRETLPALLDAVRNREAAAGIAAISITAEREAILDFSHPMFRSGLSIMVRAGEGQVDVRHIMFSKTMLAIIGIFALVILIPAHLFWAIARGRDEGLPIRERYIPGIFDAMFWCAESMGGAPQGYPRQIFPRVVAIIWLYAGIVLVSYFTAFATTSLTMQTLRGDINGPSDLSGKRVGVVKGSTAAAFVRGGKARAVEHADFASSANALVSRAVDAVVYDTPVIQFYTLREGRARLAGGQFRPENYGIAFPIGSPLRRSVNQALLNLIENGAYTSLHRKWFGEADKGEGIE